MPAQFCTVGHSNRRLEDFIAILREAGIGMLADVRTFPRSRSNPDYNLDALPEYLAPYQIVYRHMPQLGGRRGRQAEIDDEVNGLWRNRSFHNYADYALSAEFGAALEILIELGQGRRLAMMCSEAVWWRCHRRIISDHLLLNGHAVDHLMAQGRAESATPTPGAGLRDDGKVVYPAQSSA